MLRQHRSRLVLIALTLVSLQFNMISIAVADPPAKESVPLEEFILAGVCDFDELIAPLSNKEMLTTYFDKAGNVSFPSSPGT